MAVILVNPFYVSGGGGGSSTLLTDLVSWWDLSANGNDSHGSNNLSTNGSPSFGTVGGYACVTTSPGNHLYIASPTGLALDTMTVAAWVYRTGTTAAMMVAQQGDGTNAGASRYGLRTGSDDPDMRVSNGTAQQLAQIANALTVSTWKLMIGCYSSSTGDVSLYIDDGTGNTTTATGYTTLNTGAGNGFGVGGDGDGNGTGAEFEGSIKSMAVWNRVLTSDERTELWNSGVPLVYADL